MVLSNRTADYEKMAQQVFELLKTVPMDDSILSRDVYPESKEKEEDERAAYKNSLKESLRDGLDDALRALGALNIIKKFESEETKK